MAMEGEVLRTAIKKPATVRYPFEKLPPVEGLRGEPVWDMLKCIGCGLCERDCPTETIEMIGRGRTAEFKIHLDRCAYCAQCAESCPVDAIELTKEYELAAYTHEQLLKEYQRPKNQS